MKRLIRHILGILFIIFGIAATTWGGYQTIQAKWAFLTLAVYGIGMILAGWMLISGKAIRDFLETLYDIFR